MKYPKKLMSITELCKLGFSKNDLYAAAHHKHADQYIMWTKGGGKILFDTEAFEKYRGIVMRCIDVRKEYEI